MNRFPVIAIVAVAIAAFLCFISFGHENAEAYLFPQIVSGSLMGLCVLLVIREFMGNPDAAVESIELKDVLKLLPMLVLLAGYVFCIEWLGMYSSSAIALFLIAFVYHASDNWIKRFTSSFVVAILFTGFMYVVFSMLLRVQAPTGLFV